MTTNETGTPCRSTTPALEIAVRKAANEILNDATTLADFAANLTRNLTRPAQYRLLVRLARLGRDLQRTLSGLCDDSDTGRRRRSAGGG
jgi:hypothetical protein